MWQASLLRIVATSSWPVNLMPCLSNVESFLISSDFTASLGNCSLHPSVTAVCVIPSHLNSSHAFWVFFSTSSHLIPSDVLSPLSSLSHPIWCPHLITTVLIPSHVTWAFLISSHLISAYLSFWDFHSSSQLFSALRSSCKLILCVLISSLLFSHLLSYSHIYSADLSSCQLVSPHLSSSQRTLKSSHLSSGPKPALKTDLGAKASNPYVFHREYLTQRSFYTQQAFAQRSLYTQKLLHRVREAFIDSKLLHKASFCTQQTFTHSKLLHREALKQRSSCTQKLLHTASFHTEKPLQREAFTQKLLHREAFTHRSFYT